MNIDELRAKYPNQYYLFTLEESRVNPEGVYYLGEAVVFEGYLEHYMNELHFEGVLGSESWEALEAYSRSYCVRCKTSEGVDTVEGVAWCGECWVDMVEANN